MWLGSTWSNQNPFGTNPKIDQYAIEMDVWNGCGLDKSNRLKNSIKCKQNWIEISLRIDWN